MKTVVKILTKLLEPYPEIRTLDAVDGIISKRGQGDP
jgi:hypothetical protein